jgi:hypothetical protein
MTTTPSILQYKVILTKSHKLRNVINVVWKKEIMS